MHAGKGRRKHWWPRARAGSRLGDFTIRVCGLDEHIQVYDDHVNKEVRPVAADLERALATAADAPAAFDRALRLLYPSKPFVGLSYDALRTIVPNSALAKAEFAWPEPEEVPRLQRAWTRR